MNRIADFLGHHPPFDGLERGELERLAARTTVRSVAAGEEVANGFTEVVSDLVVVMSGSVGLWNSPDDFAGAPDEIVGVGGVLGYSSILTRTAQGPRAAALTDSQICLLPASSIHAVFSSVSGARFLAGRLRVARRVEPSARVTGTVDDLIRSEPMVGAASMSVAQAARLMTERNRDHLVIPRDDLGGRGYGVLTDADIRARVVAAGISTDVRVGEVMNPHAPTVLTGTPASQALVQILELDLDCLPVVDNAGRLRGVVGPGDFVAAPAGRSVTLRGEILAARTPEELAAAAQRTSYLAAELVRRGQPAREATAVLSLLNDATVRRGLELVLDQHPELDRDALTWIVLGSNARREAVLSSDLDSAVAFADTVVDPAVIDAYRVAFGEVDLLLAACGLSNDANGAVASSALFARTHRQWREAAAGWRESPLENKGMIMTSLLIDSRPIWGDHGLSAVAEVFSDLRAHPATLRLLLAESLSHKARIRSMRDVLSGRGGTFDIKSHAVLPVVNIARWGALSVGSGELDTRARLRAAAGSEMLTEDNSAVLIEVFDVLQKVRMSYQVAQLDNREPASDVITMRRLSPLDRSLVAQAVREVAAVQRRMVNLSHYVPVTR
ncbi:putative nucleotidyltransferase substrate binding domain-containing protein [Williamsia sp. CHRR-6]|uniref:putative nucleotidyltransferase substrate binding domain-containing protein n=1 Tax=Williamsia sp. CHRR-6 TaxID=2835871 RepID=UPI001BDA329B|nr:putative nucleotidyltransferase substrate binding domain-containing protein [Williamsia sp. CHRR-6]MBT0567869.1 CBS domain-containing protein [Williamsia sp. CHRR-6]